MSESADEVLFEVAGQAGLITLNRPKALNALSHGMVKAIAARLDDWETNPAITRIVLRGSGEKAFCAGGDIRQVYDMGAVQGLKSAPEQTSFFADEYILNSRIKHFPKPWVSLIDGIVMGGGVGLSVHGSHRVGTEKTLFAMPETGIGFFPDVGGSYFLPRMPRCTGYYCALTSARLKQADALLTGVLTHALASASIPVLTDALCAGEPVEAAIARHAGEAGPAPLLEVMDELERAFGLASVDQIWQALAASDSDFARNCLGMLASKSPTSLALTFEQLNRGAELDFNGCMRMEFRIVSEILKHTDFYEGVRSVLVDRDNAPRWQAASLAEVDRTGLAAYFGRPEGGDLPLP
ncbi:enoyl-CoA hydratase/isomerase family protein [Pannonibacter phragmitetus]|uniref:3-hydroxyisobutyryl-CoA hydrolase n=1 Tax=Pannonibacter phragmitetus TaxID=121719 RepID=A0A0U3PYN7_9HYPH|nr:enoyl-CoA hydratase/isomerase family protein [Pannonibacter phragmitetus]ALV29396.1 3-hydroxyisobutyryl-CoA hydrolase [Pannonibacter phragmitetus]